MDNVTKDSSIDESPTLVRRQQPPRTRKPKSFPEEDVNEVSDEEDYCTGDSSRSRKRSGKLQDSTKENASTKARNKKEPRKVVSDDQISITNASRIRTMPTNTNSHNKLNYTCKFKGLINNFNLLGLPQEAIIKKPLLDQCCLRFYPNGHPQVACPKDGVCFFIKLSTTAILKLKYEVKLFNSSGNLVTGIKDRPRDQNKKDCWFGFCRLEEKKALMSRLDKDNRITIVCTLIVDYFANGTDTLTNLHELKNKEEFCNVTFNNVGGKAIDSKAQANTSDSGRKRPRSPVESTSASSDAEEILGLSSNIIAKKLNSCNELSVLQDNQQSGSKNSAETVNDCNNAMPSKGNEQIGSEIPSQPPASKDLENTTFSKPKNGCVTQLCSFVHKHKWKVQKFGLFNCRNGKALSSPPFKIAQYPNIEIYLVLYPNGCGQNCQDNICIDLFLPQDSLDGEYEIELLNSTESKICDIKNASNSSSTYCLPKNKLMSFLQNNELIIICSISVKNSIVESNIGDEYHTQELKNQLDVLNDLYKYIEKKDACDVKVRIGDQDFYAHKTLLATRSSTFRKSFQPHKGNTPIIEIHNQIKPVVFKEILHYIYTGKILNMENSVRDLFEASFHIDLPDLRVRCEKYLIKNLSFDNVFQNLILAEKLSADELKKEARNFIVVFGEQLVNSPSFKEIRYLSFELYREIFTLFE